MRPLNLYGATKCWGEAVACFLRRPARSVPRSACALAPCRTRRDEEPKAAERYKLDHYYLDIILTYADLTRLVQASIEAPDDVRYEVFPRRLGQQVGSGWTSATRERSSATNRSTIRFAIAQQLAEQ